ncbi:MAG: tetratricopeptide repeat protein [Bacteroidota bacterium]
MKRRQFFFPFSLATSSPSLVLGLMISMGLWSCKGSQQASKSDPRLGLAEQQSILPNPERVGQLYIEATTQMIRGDLRSASDLFLEVLKLEPQHAAANFNLANISTEQRKYDDAIRYGKVALSSDPNNYWYYRTLQEAYEFQGEYKQSIEVQLAITRRFPERIEDRIRLSELYLQNQQADLALNELTQIETDFGSTQEVLLRRYQIAKQQSQWDTVLGITNDLLLMNEEEPRYFQMKHEALVQLEQEAAGIQLMQDMLEVHPDNGYALLTLADFYKNQGDTEKSDEYLYRAFGNPDIDADGKLQIIQSLMAYVQEENALLPRLQKLASIFQETHPGSASAFALQGKLFALEGKLDSARSNYLASLDLEPSNIPVWLDLIETSFRTRDFTQLNKDAEFALEYYPNQEQFLYFFGVSAIQIKDLGAAVNALEKIKRIGTAGNDLMAQACAELGQIYHRQKKYDQSDLNLQRAVTLTPEDDLLLNNYAYFLAERMERLDDAEKMAQKAVSKEPNQASYLDTYGWILYQQGKYEQAEIQLKKATELGDGAVIHEHYGDVLFKLGKKEAAVEQWKKAQEIGSDLDIDAKLQQ